jgi:hypothetical protein
MQERGAAANELRCQQENGPRYEQNTNNHPRALARLQIADGGNAPDSKLFITEARGRDLGTLLCGLKRFRRPSSRTLSDQRECRRSDVGVAWVRKAASVAPRLILIVRATMISACEIHSGSSGRALKRVLS